MPNAAGEHRGDLLFVPYFSMLFRNTERTLVQTFEDVNI